MGATTRQAVVLEQLDATRRYTRLVLAHTPAERWFEMPGGMPSHVAWQVGHITWAQAGLALGKVCGLAADDLLPRDWQGLFGKASNALAEAERYPAPDVLMRTLEDVHERVVAAVAALDATVLEEPATHATGLIHDKFGLLMWVARHEMLHVGQIGLIRRAMGLPPYR